MVKKLSFSLIYRFGQLGLDSLIAWIACILAFLIRFEGNIQQTHQGLALILPFISIPGRLLCHYIFGLYQQVWRLFGFRDSIILLSSVTFYSLALLTTTRLIIPRFTPSFSGIPLGVAVIDWCFCIMGMMLIRYARRRFTQKRMAKQKLFNQSEKRVLLVGAGQTGAMVVREVRENPQFNLKLVGFLDDDPTKLGRKVEGVKILGKTSKIYEIAEYYEVDEILISMPSASAEQIKKIVDLTQGSTFELKILPAQEEILLNQNLTAQAREISIQDILGRQEIKLNFSEQFNDQFPCAKEQIYQKKILVTGAGGTIGSEICRQIAKLKPQLLILLGRGEYSIFKIQQEFNRNFPSIEIEAIIADIRHQSRMETIFQTYQPDIVFHAAAHKHVPLMEDNPTEAIENNTLASAFLAQMAVKYDVKTFVMISTDKAVDSTNFMGLSKRLAELMVTSLAQENKTRFLVVRFGNVLGSRGSVVPIFKAQINRGGPVTVTDPEMTRYFMTTPEASQLVIQSLAVGKSGQILILDMGEPIKIYDLARQMIELAGFTPDVDIPIKITGLRPGEKLHESLVNANEKLERTHHPQLMVASNIVPSSRVLHKVIKEFEYLKIDHISQKELWELTQKFKLLLESDSSYMN